MKIAVSVSLVILILVGILMIVFGKPKEVANQNTNNNYSQTQNAAVVGSTDSKNVETTNTDLPQNNQPQMNTQTENNTPEQKEIIVRGISLQTTEGEILIELFAKETPKTAENFARLVMAGFYDNTKFHRVIKGFMIQGGDPLSKDDSKMNMWGMGNPGYKFDDEIGGTNPNNRNAVGTISMANSGPNTNGSQFFINVADNAFLDKKHTVFGRVVKGMEIVQKISEVQTGENDRPVKNVVVTKASLVTE